MKTNKRDMGCAAAAAGGALWCCLALGICGAQSVLAANGTWTGAADAAWTNSANWSSEPYPGSAAGETATFAGAGTVINLDGLASIGGVLLGGTAPFTLGTGGANAQTLALENGGILRQTVDAVGGGTVNATLWLGTNWTGAAYSIANDSPAQALTFAGAVVGPAPASGGTGTSAKYLTVGGAGPVTFGGGLDKGGAAGLVLTNALSGTLTLAGDNTLRALIFTGADGGAVDVGSGELFLDNAGTLVINATRDAVIGGAGTLRLSTLNTVSSSSFDYANIFVSAGKTLVIDTPVTGLGGIEFNTGTGTLVLNGENTFEAHVTFTSAGTISVSKIGNAGAWDSNLGRGSIIHANSSTSGSRLLYTGTGETSDRVIRLDRPLILEHAGTGTLAFTSNLDVRGNSKTLTLQGGAGGTGVIAGSIGAGTGTTSLTKRGVGTWVLGGANSFAGETAVYGGGPLVLTHPAALAGTSQVRFYNESSLPGILELAHNGVGGTPFKVIIGANNSGTVLSGNAAGNSVGITHQLGNIDLSMVTITVARAPSILTGAPAVAFGALNLSAGSSGTTTLNPTTADMFLDGAAILGNGGSPKTLRLAGLSAGNRVDGVISNGLNQLSLEKTGSSVWTLTAANTYTGTTAVAGGTLALAGAGGAIQASSGITLSGGGILLLDNASTANADRIGDNVPVTLNGGTLTLTGGSETAGALTAASGGGAVAVSPTAQLTFASLAYTGGKVDFQGVGLGQPGGPRILFTAPPVLQGDLLEPWVTVNGNLATYDVTHGIRAYIPTPGLETEIDARGPASVIPDDAGAKVRITGDGTDGPIELEEDETRVALLTQANPSYAAVVDTAGKTLRASTVTVAAGAESLTLGGAPGAGILAAPTAGGNLFLGNDSVSTLTVNAALADNGAGATVGAFGPGIVSLNGPILHTGMIAAFGGTLSFGGHEVPQAFTGIVTSAGAVVKTGTNTLHLLGANTHTGMVRIDAGVLRVDANTALGTTDVGTFINNGGTLDLGCSADVGGTRGANGLNMQAVPITVRGAGAAGAGGAIVNNSAQSQYNALGRVTLADDAVFGGISRWDIRDGALAMNGHRITKMGPNAVSLSGIEVVPGGDSAGFEVVEGSLRIQTSAQLNGSAANTISVYNGARFELYQVSQQQSWTLELNDGAAMVTVGGSGTQNRWVAPVVLNGAGSLTYSTGVLDVRGPISGVGPLLKDGDGVVTVSGTANTYTGATHIRQNKLQVASIGNVGTPSSLGQPATVAAGTIHLGTNTLSGSLEYIGAGETTDRVIDMAGTTGGGGLYHNGAGPLTFTSDLTMSVAGNKTLTLGGTSGAVAEFAGRLVDASGRTLAVTKSDTNHWLLSANNTYAGTTTIGGGLLTFSCTNTTTGVWAMNGGEVRFSGRINQGTGAVRIGNNSNSSSVMRVRPGAEVTGSGSEVSVGHGSGAAGAIYVEGGMLSRTTTSDGNQDFNIGNGQNSYGYLHVSGEGVVSNNTRLTVGGWNTTDRQGTGIVRLSGNGKLKIPRYALVGRNVGSFGILTVQDNAVFDHTGAPNGNNIILGQNGGRGDLNLLGGTVESAGSNVGAREGSSGVATGSVNLVSGTLRANAITVSQPDSSVFVNFSGGRFKTGAAGTPLPATLTAVTLFTGGAVIDTDGLNATIAKPLTAPAGDSVTGIALTSGGSGYIGEPLVTIQPPSPGGVPATAVAEMEPDGNGALRVASVRITSPGSRYAAAPTVSFSGGGTQATQARAGAVTIAPDAGGGLTKAGAGTLTLGATNTYAGPTVVAAGTLKLGNAKALPFGGRAEALAGGTLDLSGYTVTNTLGGTGGTLMNGTVSATFSPAGTGAVGTDVLTLSGVTLTDILYLADVTETGECDHVTVHGNLNLSGMTVTVVDPQRLDRSRRSYTLLTCDGAMAGVPTLTAAQDSRWHLFVRPNRDVRLMFTDGTVLILR